MSRFILRRRLSVVRRFWCRAACRIVGIQIDVHGAPIKQSPVIYVANHVSYLDVIALGSFVDATFIAKAEIRSWPLFGQMGRLVGTYFVRRHWREAKNQTEEIIKRISAGEDFILFGEGTSSNGLQVLPFKTSLFAVLEPWRAMRPVSIQPVTLQYQHLKDGSVIDKSNVELYAWFGASPFVPHVLRVMRMKGVRIRVVFGGAHYSWGIDNRKQLANSTRDEICREIERPIKVISRGKRKKWRIPTRRILPTRKKEAA